MFYWLNQTKGVFYFHFINYKTLNTLNFVLHPISQTIRIKHCGIQYKTTLMNMAFVQGFTQKWVSSQLWQWSKDITTYQTALHPHQDHSSKKAPMVAAFATATAITQTTITHLAPHSDHPGYEYTAVLYLATFLSVPLLSWHSQRALCAKLFHSPLCFWPRDFCRTVGLVASTHTNARVHACSHTHNTIVESYCEF